MTFRDKIFPVAVSPTMALLQAIKLGTAGDPEGNAIAGRNALTLTNEQQRQLSICPVTAQINDSSHTVVTEGLEQGVRQSEAWVAFTGPNQPSA